jgi:hypothetical protein
LNIEEQTKVRIRGILVSGFRRAEYARLYEEFFPYKEKNPAFYEMALGLIVSRLIELNVSGDLLHKISLIWRF